MTAVGDSVMLASATALEAALPGAYIDAKIDRQMQAGLTLIRSLAATGLVVARSWWSASARTATSPPASSGNCSGPLGRAANSCWSARFGPQAWEHAVNTALAAAARRGKHTELADWHQAIAAQPALLWPDGIHPRPAGARLYARVVLSAIKSGLTASQRPSCPASPSGSA